MDAGISVDSYGKCLNNREFKDASDTRLKHKLEMMKPYKFTFSFENAEHDDYVSEKMFGPLAAGSVPSSEIW